MALVAAFLPFISPRRRELHPPEYRGSSLPYLLFPAGILLLSLLFSSASIVRDEDSHGVTKVL